MNDKTEAATDVQLIYPLVQITMRSTITVDGKPVLMECEEVIDARQTHEHAPVHRILEEFKKYVRKVRQAAESPQGRADVQRILDNPPLAPSPLSEDPPSSPVPPVE